MNINHKIRQVVEAVFWAVIIICTILIYTQFPVEEARGLMQYVLLASLFAAIYFYLSSKSLYQQNINTNRELKNKQEIISGKEKTLDLIINNSAEGIVILDEEKRVEFFSPGMEKITGYSKSEALGRSAQSFLKFQSGEYTSLLPDLMFTDSHIKKDSPYIKNSLQTKDGKRIDIEASYTIIRNQSDNKTKSLAIIRDINYEKALTERDKEFIAVTSHQLNTPLSIIRGYSSLLLKESTGKINSKQKDYLKEINQATVKMISLTNNLLSISRIEQEKIKLTIQDVNVADMIGKIVKIFKPEAENKKIKLISSKIDKNIVISADDDKLSQAISNLIDNAVKYTKKGSVSLTITTNNNQILFEISDTGIGIPKDELDKVGEKFYRAQGAINIDNKGTGLGVFIAKTIIEKHQGNFKISSKVGQGTKITITLPNSIKSKANFRA